MSGKSTRTGRVDNQSWTSDGTWVNIGGDRNWRNNNPGNLEHGDFAKSHGAIGSDGRFAIFPDYKTGKEALLSLLMTEAYQVLTFAEAIERFAPSIENDVPAYVAFIAREAKLDPHTTLSNITKEHLAALAAAIERFEGGRKGVSYDLNDPSVAESAAQIQQIVRTQTV